MPNLELNRTRIAQSWDRRVRWLDGVLIEDGTTSFNTTVDTSRLEKNWARTPNYWTLRRNRSQLPDNGFTFSRRIHQSEDWVFSGEENVGPERTWISFSRPAESLCKLENTGFTVSEFDLLANLIGKARSSDFNISVTLAEAGRTVQMVTGLASSMASSIRNLRRGNLRGALADLGLEDPTRSQESRYNRRYGRDPTGTAANYWLGLQYGWKPLLNDAKNAAEALAEAVSRNGNSSVMTVRSSISGRFRYVEPQTGAFIGQLIQTEVASRRAVWRFKPKAADLPGLFGLLNPMEVVWELVPFSFVADWFLPIGNYLSTLDAPLRFEHVGGSKGYRKVVNATTQITQGKGIFNSPHLNGGGTGTMSLVQVTRTPLTSIPSPSLSDMTFNPRINASRAASGIALLRQQASRL